MLDNNLYIRSFLFLPAHNQKFIDKSLNCKADAIILDVEDSVPSSKKTEARANIIANNKQGLFNKRRNIFIRINPIETDDFVEDIFNLTLPNIDGFMPSKIENAKDIEFLDNLLDFFERKNHLPNGKFKLAPLIETTKAIEQIHDIAKASKRIVALCLGGEDYLNDLGSVYTYQETALSYPRALIVNAARANNILPIDTPFLDIKNIEEFKEKETLAYKNGFAGCLILNPIQIEPANEVFKPSKEKIEFSKKVIASINDISNKGTSSIAMLNGIVIGPPMKKRAENVLRQSELLK